MRNQEAELGGLVCLEVTVAVVEQVVHEQTEWTQGEAYFENLEDCDHLERMALDEFISECPKDCAFDPECLLY